MTVRSIRHNLVGRFGPGCLLFAVYLIHYFYVLFSGYIRIFPDSDAEFYWRWSLDLLLGKFSVPFIGVPGYPFFLALSRIFFPTVELQVLLNHLLTAGAGFFLYLIVANLTNRGWAFISLLLFLTYTPFMMYSSILTPEPLGLFLLGLGLFLAVQGKVSLPKALVLGFVFGFLGIVRPALLLFGLALGVYLFSIGRYNERYRGFLGYYLAFSIFPLGVFLANGIGGDFWGISTHAGINFYIGNSPHSTGTFYFSLPLRPTQSGLIEDARIVASKLEGRPLTHAQSCEYWMEKAMKFIVSHPWEWIKQMIKKLLLIYNRQEYHDANWLSMRIPILPFLNFSFIFPFSLLALWTTRRNRVVGVLRLALVLTTISTILVFINTRYKLMIVFPSIALAGLGIRDFIHTLKKGSVNVFLVYFLVLLGLFEIGQVRWVELSPSTKAIMFNKAMELFEAGHVSEAESMFKEILMQYPDDYLTWFALGNVYYSKGMIKKAMACYRKANQINSLFADAVFNFGVSAMELGKYKVAYNCFRQLYQVSPDKPDVVLNLVYCMAKLGMCSDASYLLDRFLTKEKVKVSEADITKVKEEIRRCRKGI